MGLTLPSQVSAPAAAALGTSWPQVDEDSVDALAATFDHTADALDAHALDADRHTQGVLSASSGGLARGLTHASGRLVGSADSTAATTSARLRRASAELTADAADVRGTKVGVIDDLSTLTERLALLQATGPLTAGGSSLLPDDEVHAAAQAIAHRHATLVDALGGSGAPGPGGHGADPLHQVVDHVTGLAAPVTAALPHPGAAAGAPGAGVVDAAAGAVDGVRGDGATGPHGADAGLGPLGAGGPGAAGAVPGPSAADPSLLHPDPTLLHPELTTPVVADPGARHADLPHADLPTPGPTGSVSAPVGPAPGPDDPGPVRVPATGPDLPPVHAPDADPAGVSVQGAAAPVLAPPAVGPTPGAPVAPTVTSPVTAAPPSVLGGPGPAFPAGGAGPLGSAPVPASAAPPTAGGAPPLSAGPAPASGPGASTAPPASPAPGTAAPRPLTPPPTSPATTSPAPAAGTTPQPGTAARASAALAVDHAASGRAADTPAGRTDAEPSVLLLFVAFPAGTAPVRTARPARQLPPPVGEARPGLCCPPGDHPAHPDLALPADPLPLPAAVPLDKTRLLHGWDPLGGGNERELERRFVVRPAADGRPAEHVWPLAELHPEGAVAPDRRRAVRLEVGAVLDLLGSAEGRVVAEGGTPFARRSEPAEHAERPLRRLRVVRALPAWESHLAGWFAQPGGGLRYRLTHPVAELVAAGWLADAAGEESGGR